MAEKPKKKSSRRNYLARKFLELGNLTSGLPAQLTYLQMSIGLVLALAFTFLLVEFQFQSIPDYRVGDIADRTIEAPRDFTVEDLEATREKQEEIIGSVPQVYDFDFRINGMVVRELRDSFELGRSLLAGKLQALNAEAFQDLSAKDRHSLKEELQVRLPRFSQDKLLDICLRLGFSTELENQLAGLLIEAMKFPGVVAKRDTLLQHQERGIVLHNTVTGHSEPLADWTAIRDLSQARDVLRQNEYELTLVGGEEKKVLINFLDRWVMPNVRLDEEATRERVQAALAEMDPVLIQVKSGKTIIRAGDEISERQLSQLAALKRLKSSSRLAGRMTGIFLLVGFLLFILWQYFRLHEKEYEHKIQSNFYLQVLVLTISLLVIRLFLPLAQAVADSLRIDALQDPQHFYLFAPYSMGAMLIMLLAGANLAILFCLVFSIFIGLLSGSLSLSVYTLTASLAAVYVLDKYRQRMVLVRAGLIVGVVSAVTALALQLYTGMDSLQWTVVGLRSSAGLASGVFAVMSTSVFLPMLESWFGITTDIRLLELSNLNSAILRRLAVEAPGTYHHSIIVGTLAEAGAEAIAANSLLVRVSAYYHDIGKLKNPEYFVENQIYCANKHELLSPSMSSLVLASHVKDGVAIAEQIKLPPKVREMIPQHHGTRLMTFFYQKARERADGKNGEVDEEDFRYPGPKPQTKEAAILMLADQVEAAARTLQEPTSGQIRSMIGRVVQATIQDGQFDECDIMMKELRKVAQAFERVINGMYHHRIEYPGFEFNETVEARRLPHQRIQ